ncbi:hypothetical protein [Leifsonia sp. Leaf264]|uniref:hypothetical protein n=1 Tax=Leifsonia sp. Leaf264 TaxID=1736314 RepID=UPI0006F98B5E|nr:hypothetical protein [Leifsonia sp. Leaf264]KQO98633.1 hypothetical protein ASF30_11260 [Leifsonia sp. Leaf264]
MRNTLNRLRRDQRGAINVMSVMGAMFVVAAVVGLTLAIVATVWVQNLHDDLRDDIRHAASQEYGLKLTDAQAEKLMPYDARRSDVEVHPEYGVKIDGKQYTVHYVDSTDGPRLVQPDGTELPKS